MSKVRALVLGQVGGRAVQRMTRDTCCGDDEIWREEEKRRAIHHLLSPWPSPEARWLEPPVWPPPAKIRKRKEWQEKSIGKMSCSWE
jgi:hypothetical protein